MGRHMKNVVVVSFGFLLLFTATGSLLNLQSSLNADEGMGLASNSVTFSSIILSSMFITPTAIRYLGCKWTIFAGMACNVVYTVRHFLSKLLQSHNSPVSWCFCSGSLIQTSCPSSLLSVACGEWQMSCGKHKPTPFMEFSFIARRRQHLPTIVFGSPWAM
ncbi:protein unc-93 homolog A-like [Alosa sapidissima]|uniref:protein unc-93 homolog A-like n=1 Tax=Alosa sapidissima TaxID=34773 RepID=UPI001C0848CB|nr:protein unc-93 homolog A-like [Alosa sapidissima]